MEGFDPSLSLSHSLKDERAKNHEQLALLKGEEECYSDAFDQLLYECRNVTSDIKGLLGQRDELNQPIQAKTAEREELSLKDNFEVV